jgi:hypothetical protein
MATTDKVERDKIILNNYSNNLNHTLDQQTVLVLTSQRSQFKIRKGIHGDWELGVGTLINK